ncbi:MAG TPA: LysR substrate-binding domain-containing protein, partial [Rhizomicrobium sp.]|nr:LysR substrate-binding domain-containing protein [Rhizomicrobium sp.]
EQLRIFVAVAERLHMTRAAEALHLTQSAVSAAIAALEERYNVRLFDRVGRHLELSEAGRAFLPEARALLQDAQSAVQTLDDLAGLKRGTLTIAGSQTVFNYWLPMRAARFSERYPAIALRLIAGNTAQVAQAVLNGDADLGFVEGIVNEPKLARKKISTDRIAIYVAKRHPLAGKPVRPSDLMKSAWILREEGSGTRAHFESAMRKKGIDPAKLNVVMTLPSNEAALAAVEGSAALTAVSELAATPHIAADLLTKLKFDLPERTFELLTAKERNRSRAAAAFLEMLG